MKKIVLALAASALLTPSLGYAQVDLAIHFDVLPPLVVVSPGVQVVSDFEEEVFYVDGWYWLRRGPSWYRSRDHRARWVVVESAHVPAKLVKIPPGHYKRYKAAKPAKAEQKHHGKEKAQHRAHDGDRGGRGHGKKGKH